MGRFLFVSPRSGPRPATNLQWAHFPDSFNRFPSEVAENQALQPCVHVTTKICFRDSQIEMADGAGGKASRRLVEGLFAPLLFGPSIEPLGDTAHLEINGACLAITASYEGTRVIDMLVGDPLPRIC